MKFHTFPPAQTVEALASRDVHEMNAVVIPGFRLPHEGVENQVVPPFLSRPKVDDGLPFRALVNRALLSLPWVVWRAEEVRTPLCF